MMRDKKIQSKIAYIKKIDAAILAIVFISFIALIVGVWYASDRFRTEQTGLIQEMMDLVSTNQKNQFETYVNEKVELLQGLADFSTVASMNMKLISNLLKGRAEELGFLHFFVMDTKGLAYYIEEGTYKDQSLEDFFYNVNSNHVYITQPYYAENYTFMTICVSIFDIKEQKIGSLCGAIKLDSIRNIFIETETVLDGEIFLVNREGKYVATTDMNKVYNQKSIYNEGDADCELIKDTFAKKIDQSGTMIKDGYRQQTKTTYLKNYDWVLVQCVRTDKIFETVSYIDLVKWAALVIVGVILFCVVRIAMHWRKSERRINTDTLTGCNSRAAMENMLDNIECSKQHAITIMYLDLNKFKLINDTYGHDVGDKVLCVFADTLKMVFKKRGFVGRMGGDEFMVILFDIPDNEIQTLCRFLQASLKKASEKLGFDYEITTSVGYATRPKGNIEPLISFINKADEEMYKYKEVHKMSR